MLSALRENERMALAELKEALSRRFGPGDVRLYGSAARGQSAADSDEDGPMSESPLYKNVVREGVPL